MINLRLLIVPPALLGSGHAELNMPVKKQATDFLRLLLDMANIRVHRFRELIVSDGIPRAADALYRFTDSRTRWR
jgi:hypothetical protein